MKPERFEPLAMAIGDLYWAHLTMRCICQEASVSMLLLCTEVDHHTPLAAVLPRFKCRFCGGYPERIALASNPPGFVDGVETDPGAWSIDLSAAAKCLRSDFAKAA